MRIFINELNNLISLMNITNLEQRTDSQAGIKIIESCLMQIKNYEDFQSRKGILLEFLKKEYPYIKIIDKMAIIDMISKQLEDYEYDYKVLTKGPSTVFSHPFVAERKPEVIPQLLKLINEREKEYIEYLNQRYSNIPDQ